MHHHATVRLRRTPALIARLLPAWAIVALLCARPAVAGSVQDLCRLKGLERNTLSGLGIVVGLNGTGDKHKDSLVAARPFAQFLKNMDGSIGSLDELKKVDGFAVVQVTMNIPAAGAAEGDRFDVTVNSLFNCKSIAGGSLVVSMLRVPLPDPGSIPVMAFAQGPLVVEGANPRSGVVRQGGQMLRTLVADPVAPDGTITLVLRDEFAGYPVASAVAGVINEEMALLGIQAPARVEDPKSVRVRVPESERRDPSRFLARVMTFHVDQTLLRTPARIVVNEREGIIVVTDNVEIRPVAIAHAGLQITTITPQPVGTPEAPVATTVRWAGVAAGMSVPAQPAGGTRLSDLLRALDQLDVPVRDQIAILYELRRSGALSAEIVSE